MKRVLAALWLAAACLASARAQDIRAVPEAAVSAPLAPSAAGASSVAGLVLPSLPSVAAPSSLGAAVSAPSAATPVPAAPAALPALPASAIAGAYDAPQAAPAAVAAAPSISAAQATPSASAASAAPSANAASAHAEAFAAQPPQASGAPAVLRSLKDLAVLLGDGSRLPGAREFDGSADRAELVDPAGARPSVPQGVTRVTVQPLSTPADVDVIPNLGNSAALHDELRAHLSSMLPLDIFVYHDARGGRFMGLDLSRNPANAARVPELQAHEVDTIRRIQEVTRDLQVLVREAGATPDLIVRGVPMEMKSVHSGDVAVQVAHANAQLLAHAQRHGLGLGAVVLDVIGREIPVERVEAGIAAAKARAERVGFSHVYAFNGGAWQTYARGVDGEFRLSRAEAPFAPAAGRAPRLALVPAALERAVVPAAEEMRREVEEPTRMLRERGIRAIVTAYGSARIPSPEKARAALAQLEAELGAHPSDLAARKRLAAAREAVFMSRYYQVARDLGALVAREGGGRVAMVTGGGPGIMEAANRGAFEAGGPSVGFNIVLPYEQNANPYATPGLEFSFQNFATRKMALRRGAMGLVYFPGGFGTMDELFEVLTLMQTGKMPRAPIVLIGRRSYWKKILDFSEFDHMGLISHEDLSLFTYAETAEQAWAAIQSYHQAQAAVAAQP